MSFLFEIQSKKAVKGGEKRKVSMDVRVNKAPASFHHSRASHSAPYRFSRPAGRLDGVKKVAQPVNFSSPYAERLQELELQKKVSKTRLALPSFDFFSSLQDRIHFSLPRLTPNKLVYGSIMSGVAFGMISLGVIEKTFESNADAAEEAPKVETIALETNNYNPEKDVFLQYFSDAADAEYQESVREMVKGHPIEEMLPYIFKKDRVTAAFLIGIAKKESNWGKRRPVLDGQDCFNYWGYRGQRRLMGSGGHTCFNSREDAVDTVAKRLENLIHSERLNTPAKLIVWKCGMSCEGHGKESVQKWISDVDAYYSEMMALEAQNTEIEDIEEAPDS